jgi:maltose alpha-D-glucosyltransferase/alpha-amylase
MDSVYGYQGVNVEAQSKSPSSLLNWLRKLIAVRQGHRVFGRGTLTFLSPANRKVIAYLREFEGETVLCIANLAHSPQQAALDLSPFKGRIPVEMIGWSSFGTVAGDRYVITLPEHGFFWLLLSETAQPPAWEVPLPDELPELITLVLPREAGNETVSFKAISLLEDDVLPLYFPKQPWFAPKNRAIAGVHFVDTVSLGSDPHPSYLSLFDVTFDDGEHASYFVPLVIAYESDDAREKGMTRATLARVRRGARAGFLYDAFATDTFALAVAEERVRRERDGEVQSPSPQRDPDDPSPAGQRRGRDRRADHAQGLSCALSRSATRSRGRTFSGRGALSQHARALRLGRISPAGSGADGALPAQALRRVARRYVGDDISLSRALLRPAAQLGDER